eukprot:gene14116-21629_t
MAGRLGSLSPTTRCLGDMGITIGFKALSLKKMGVTSLEGLGQQLELEYLYLQSNKLQNFQHLGVQPALREVHLENNSISTLAGLVRQPRIEVVCLAGNPIAKHPHYRLMVLLCCGPALRKIDTSMVAPAEREMVRRFPEAVAYAVSCGWLMDLKKRSHAEYVLLAEETRQALQLAPGQPPAAPPAISNGTFRDVYSAMTGGLVPKAAGAPTRWERARGESDSGGGSGGDAGSLPSLQRGSDARARAFAQNYLLHSAYNSNLDPTNPNRAASVLSTAQSEYKEEEGSPTG